MKCFRIYLLIFRIFILNSHAACKTGRFLYEFLLVVILCVIFMKSGVSEFVLLMYFLLFEVIILIFYMSFCKSVCYFESYEKFFFLVQTLPLHRNSGDNEDVVCGTLSLRIESRERITPPVTDLLSSSPVLFTRLSSVPSLPVQDSCNRTSLEESISPRLEAVELQRPPLSPDIEVISQPPPSDQEISNPASPSVVEFQSPPILESFSIPEPAVVELQSVLPSTELINPAAEISVIEISCPPTSTVELRNSPPVPPPHERRHRQSSNRAPVPEPRRHRTSRPPPVNISRGTTGVLEISAASSQTAVAPECSDVDLGSGVVRSRRQMGGAEVACGSSGTVIYRRAANNSIIGLSHHRRISRPSNAVRTRAATSTCMANLPDGYGENFYYLQLTCFRALHATSTTSVGCWKRFLYTNASASDQVIWKKSSLSYQVFQMMLMYLKKYKKVTACIKAYSCSKLRPVVCLHI